MIKWIGSPNFGYPDGEKGRWGERPIVVVFHIAEGSLVGCDSWFRNKDSGVSAHYCVGKNGEIHQYVSEGDAAWGNGLVNKPTIVLPRESNPNLWTISVEHEGFSGELWTKEMYEADAILLLGINRRWGIKIDKEHVIGHCEIDSVNRANCPGSGFEFDKLFVYG
jgi:N-acetyl-anhydromuramyl-L-alanine amidase AmpD